MGYAHINNLYKDQRILLFKECYALEKIHGTSAHISLKEGNLTFFGGGEKHENFVALFHPDDLRPRLAEIASAITIYGEAYGGKCQGMKDTYGPSLRFVAFEVLIGDSWLVVPQAHDVVEKVGLAFVDYVLIPTDLTAIDAERDRDSVQAVRNGMGPGKLREGVVLRPLIEVTTNSGERIVAKHKRVEFAETKTPRAVDPDKLTVIQDAERAADEWVTEMRLAHVLDRLGNPTEVSDTGKVIAAMVEDVTREEAGEILDSKTVRQAISKRAAKMFKQRVTQVPQ